MNQISKVIIRLAGIILCLLLLRSALVAQSFNHAENQTFSSSYWSMNLSLGINIDNTNVGPSSSLSLSYFLNRNSNLGLDLNFNTYHIRIPYENNSGLSVASSVSRVWSLGIYSERYFLKGPFRIYLGALVGYGVYMDGDYGFTSKEFENKSAQITTFGYLGMQLRISKRFYINIKNGYRMQYLSFTDNNFGDIIEFDGTSKRYEISGGFSYYF